MVLTITQKEVQDATKAYNEQKGKLTELETELKNTTKAYDSMSEELENMPNEITKATIATQEMINKQQKNARRIPQKWWCSVWLC